MAAKLAAMGLSQDGRDLRGLSQRVREMGGSVGEVDDAAFMRLVAQAGKEVSV